MFCKARESETVVDSNTFEVAVNFNCKNSSHYVAIDEVKEMEYLLRENGSSFGVANLVNETI